MNSRINSILGAACSLLVTLGLTQSATGQSGPILFNSLGATNGSSVTPAQVWVVNPDGTNLRQLTAAKTSSGGAAWHPSYQYISFFRDGNLVVMPALPEGKSVKPFVVGPAHSVGADFSPDGGSIVYVGPRPSDNKGVCMIVRTVDPARRKVGAPTVVWQQDCYAPSFSPDGTKIAFSSHYGTTDGGPHIKILDLVTATASSFDSLIGFIPTWSANAQSIAFCGHTGATGSTPGDATTEVFIMNTDFSGLTQVTGLGNDVAWPSFSPAGDELVFTSRFEGEAALYRVSLNSGAVTLFRPLANGAHWTP